MNDDRWRRIRAYITSANTTMDSIPMPEPPRAPEMWDGITLDAHEMYRAYNGLPEDMQELTAKVHFLCMDVLELQRTTAMRALWARYVLGLVAHELPYDRDSLYDVPPRKPVHEYLTLVRDDDEDEEPDPDEVMLAEAARKAEAHVRALLAERDRVALARQAEDAEDAGPFLEATEDASPDTEDEDASPDTENASPAPDTEVTDAVRPEVTDAVPPEVMAVTAVALPGPPPHARSRRMGRACVASVMGLVAVCAGLSIWHHALAPARVAPASTIHPLDQSLQAGDMTVFVNYAQHTEDATEVHVRVVNFGAAPAAATLSVGDDGIDVPAEPAMVPGRSTQHRVLRVRKDRNRVDPVRIRLGGSEDVLLIEP